MRTLRCPKSSDRGALLFAGGGDSLSTRSFGTTGPFQYALTLLPGGYLVSYQTGMSQPERCTYNALPCDDEAPFCP